MTESVSEISIRDRALAAYQSAMDETALREEETRRHMLRQDLQAFAQALRIRLGINASPESLIHDIGDGVKLAHLRGDAPCFVVPCYACGRDVPARDYAVYDWESLGRIIASHERDPIKEICHDCREQEYQVRETLAVEAASMAPKKPTLEEKLLDDLRALIRNEIYRAVENP